MKFIKNGVVRNLIVFKLFESGFFDLLELYSECVMEFFLDVVMIVSLMFCDYEMVLFMDNILGF